MSTIELIKRLRQETGLSMSVIKEAVTTHQTYDAAKAYLEQYRQEDQHDMVGKKGMVVARVDGHVGILYEVNAMTDFVTTNQAFVDFVSDLGTLLLNNPKVSLDDIPHMHMQSSTVEDARIKLETLIGEHVKISRFESVVKLEGQHFGVYQHHNHKSATITVLQGGSEDVANMIAKQVTAIGALYPKWKKTVIDQILQSTLFGTEHSVQTYLEEAQATLAFASRFEIGEAMTEHLSCSLLNKDACHVS